VGEEEALATFPGHDEPAVRDALAGLGFEPVVLEFDGEPASWLRALREGRRPDGAHYFPAFPYPSFTLISDADLRDLWAYLRTLAPNAACVPVRGYAGWPARTGEREGKG